MCGALCRSIQTIKTETFIYELAYTIIKMNFDEIYKLKYVELETDNLQIVDKPKRGSFLWAVEQMKQGKKVRCAKWSPGLNVWLDINTFMNKNNFGTQEPLLRLDWVAANDWEIYEEPKKTLWDKKKTEFVKDDEFVKSFDALDVKEALQELMEHMDKRASAAGVHILKQGIKEVCGEEFLDE